MVMPNLLLQKTSVKCKTADVKKHIKRRLLLWQNKQINELVDEGCSIQNRLSQEGKKLRDMEEIARMFSHLMMQGKINPAIRLLDQNNTGGILPLNDETMQCLRDFFFLFFFSI